MIFLVLGGGSLKRLVAVAVVAAALASAGLAGGARAGRSARYIVVLRDRALSPARLAREHAGKHAVQVGHVFGHALVGYSGVMSEEAARRLASDPRIAYVEEDRPVRAAAQTLPTGVNRVDAERSATAQVDGRDERVPVDVAVLDTGIDVDHPDLNVSGRAKNCSSGAGVDDQNGHGTHVAGTIGALDNDFGVVGVAPGARLWPVRVLNSSGRGTISSVICGIDWVTANAGAIEVANLSFSGEGTEPASSGCATGRALHDAVCRSVAAGVTYAVAAGNRFGNAANHVPGAYDEVITVSALADFDGESGGTAAPTCRLDEDDSFASFSSYGTDVDLIAPGVCIESTWRAGAYRVISGTSMATPHVAGAAALYKANNPAASPRQVRRALIEAGNGDWNNADDGDGVKEPLLGVSSL